MEELTAERPELNRYSLDVVWGRFPESGKWSLHR
jgi:hypothetical protein